MEFNFDWNNLNAGQDPFATKKSGWETDTRFYNLKRDENGNGSAIIRFLPDGDLREVNGHKSMGTIQKVFKINVNNTMNGKRRFVSEWSPQTVGKPDPFFEEWQRLWNAGEKDKARMYSRTTRYIANIKVLKDPACPENEGKIFLLDMSQTLANKIESYLQPSESDIALGVEPKQLFNPMKGSSFRLVSKKGSNGFINYDSSEPVQDGSAIYESAEAAIKDIKENCHKLSWFLDEKNYLSYDELKEKFEYVNFRTQGSAEPQQVKTQVVDEFVAASSATASAASVTTQAAQAPAHQTVQVETVQTQTKSKEESDLEALLNDLV